jgi:hypothetical protein
MAEKRPQVAPRLERMVAPAGTASPGSASRPLASPRQRESVSSAWTFKLSKRTALSQPVNAK